MMNSMNLGHITASLLSSFRLVPPAAIPAMLDCILASTNTSPYSLFNSLLEEFTNVTKEITEGSEKRDRGKQCCIGSYVGALCYLLKKSGTNINAIELFIWRTFLPILKVVHASHAEIYNEVSCMFFDVVAQTNSWRVVETSLIPFLFRLVGISMRMIHSQESAIFEWSSHLNLQLSNDQSTNWQSSQCSNGKLANYLNMEPQLSQPDYLPPTVSCNILILTLNAALEYEHVDGTCTLGFASEGSVGNFARNLLWELCELSFQMLSQTVEHRSSAIRILLPSIFEALESNCSFEVSIHGQKHLFSRDHLLEKIWACCKRLFSLGLSERRDAYSILSLYLSSSFRNKSKDGNLNGKGETFDLRGDKEIWDEVKRGLVDKDNLVRKQSLHILKRVLNLSEQSISDPSFSESISDVKMSAPCGLTKRERWAEKEAISLGVGKIYNVSDNGFNSQQKWGAFTLLYEMLEEYGTHLVEAAWDHQMSLLLRSSFALENQVNSSCGEANQNKMETSNEIFQWLPVLWERGFYHDNPQVRCLIMQSFLSIAWGDYESYLRLVPEEFILGPLMQGLNDPVHHKDFGLKGIYSSQTINSAAHFLSQYCSYLDKGKQFKFLSSLALLSKKHSFGRSGLMCFAECFAAATHGFQRHDQICSLTGNSLESDKTDLLDLFRFIIESSKQHFNASYRFQVCEKILDAAASSMSPVDVPLEILLHFISSLPREFTDFGGSLRMKIQKWLLMWNEEHFSSNYCRKNLKLSESLAGFPRNFVYCHPADAHVIYDDEDLDKWDWEARRWARVTFLVLKEDNLDNIFTFIEDHGFNLCKEDNPLEWVPVKYFIIISSLSQELQVIQKKIAESPWKERIKTAPHIPTVLSQRDFLNGSTLIENISNLFLSVMEKAVSFAKSSSSVFWSCLVEDQSILPGSVRGRLGGPSQRRLSSSATTSVLQAITSLKSVASISRWNAQFRPESCVLLESALIFLWNFCWKVIKSPLGRSESEVEISLASYEAMAQVLKELVPALSFSSLHLIMDRDNLSDMEADNEKFLDSFVQSFLQNVNNLIAVENLVRTRRAILMNWKWICLESLLSIPKFVLANENGIHMGNSMFFFSDNTVTWIFNDLVDNLENAGEVSVLPILRSVRLIIELFASGRMGSMVSSCNGLHPQMMWDLVKPCWILHVSCNKRRVAPIAALLSSVLHYLVFGDKRMHEFDDGPGPLKWFIKQMLDEGTRSPRTIRLSALHLTGLWLRNPATIKYYMSELKLLTLYGSVAFDEDFEAELAENQDAKSEVSTLAQSPDPELTEEFINTELYARVSVAVLFNKLADMADLVGSDEKEKDENCLAALASGKLFLLELLHSAVDEKDLSKELYKKYSAIHRRKIRVWQMICILSRFIDQDILEKVTCSLHKALQRNNLPSVRQYLETFAIQIYLKFPFLVGQQLVLLLRDYDIRPQALSSYVFVAANVILHAAKPIQSMHLNELLPPIIPLLTSHHHTLRGFSQLLVHQILQKRLHARDSDASDMMSLEERCLMDLESYLMCNPDCARLRASMEGYLDAFDPDISITPAGIFTNRVEELEFECVPKTLMDQVITFLNDARDDLRCSMAKDAATIKNEPLQINAYTSQNTGEENSFMHLPEDVTMDFQKKFTLYQHEMQTASGIFTDKKESFRSFTDIEKEDRLLDDLLHSRSRAVQKLRESRQHFVLVASLIDRIPNLAGLARTCEVFRAAGLAIADKNMLRDKQFQLISVTAEKWLPISEVPVSTMKVFLQKKKREGFAILGLEQTANSIPLDQYAFPRKTVLVLGREKEGIPVEIIHILDACVEIPQLGVVRSLNVHVSGAIALWEYTRQQRSQ